MGMPVNANIVVQRFVDRRHFYSAVSLRAQFVAAVAGEGPEEFDTKDGTAFIVRHQDAYHFVTNRHVLDYNYGRAKGEQVPFRCTEIRSVARVLPAHRPI